MHIYTIHTWLSVFMFQVNILAAIKEKIKCSNDVPNYKICDEIK